MRLFNTNPQFRTSVVLVTLVAFLLLGFCPLRNVLVKGMGGAPEKTGKLIPEYRKISSATYCEVAYRLKMIAPTEKLDHAPSDRLSADFPAASFTYNILHPVAGLASSLRLHHWQVSAPLYLRNRVFRI